MAFTETASTLLSARLRRFSQVTDIDLRLLSMAGAIAATWVFFSVATDGIFITPRNLWNLAVQASVVALIAHGMVLIIVSRNIDLSVGSLLAFLGLFGGYIQTEILPLEGPFSWWVSMIAMVAMGAAMGALQGSIIAVFAIPSFVVTLGGLMFFRGAGWLFTQGRTITPLDSTYSLVSSSIGENWSWIVGAICFLILTGITFWKRGNRAKLGFTVKPIALELALLVVWGLVIVVFVRTMNAYTFPRSEVGRGIPVPVLIVMVVFGIMVYVANLTRFGRYIYGYGGNPEAAQLNGINVKAIVIASYALIGGLTAIGAMITTARLNAAPLSIGNLLELHVIAAAVIGGTSLSGGIGTITGAILGALLMQTLENGMVLIGLDSAPQQMIMALVLIFAVWLDVFYQKRRH